MANKKNQIYIQQGTEFIDILNHVNYHKGKAKCIPIILSGPPGTGKTTLTEDIARELDCEYREINGHPGLTREDLEGIPTLINGNSIWKNGVVPDAIEIANRDGLCVLTINEYNLMRPEIQASTNSLLDYQGRFRLTTNANELFEVNEGKTLIVIATQNENIEGVFPIQQSVLTRVQFKINLDYLKKSLEIKVLQMKTGVKRQIADIVCDAAIELRRAATKADATIQRSISTRELLAFCNAIKVPGIKLETAFDYTIVNKLIEEPSEKRAIYTLIAEGKNFFRKIRAELAQEPKSTISKQTTQINGDTIDVISINQRKGALAVEKYKVYKVNALPTRVFYQGKEYDVSDKGKWCPVGVTVAKILSNRNVLQLYTKHTTSSKDVVETQVRFIIYNE